MATSRLAAFAFVSWALMAATIAAGQQAQPGPTPPTAAQAPKPAPIGATQPQPAKVGSALKPGAPSPEFIAEARDAGFKPMQVRGSLMFCRVAIELGSNFPVRTCYDEQHTRMKLEQYQAQREQLRQGRFLSPAMPAGCSARACQ